MTNKELNAAFISVKDRNEVFPFNQHIRYSEIKGIYDKQHITECNRHDLYIMVLALMNELANMGSTLSIKDILYYNAGCIITE